MKKLIYLVLLLAACQSPDHEGIYVLHFQHEYSKADDTLEIRDGIVTKRTGFQRIRNGQLRPREYKVTRWRLNEPGSALITFEQGGVRIGKNIYQKIN